MAKRATLIERLRTLEANRSGTVKAAMDAEELAARLLDVIGVSDPAPGATGELVAGLVRRVRVNRDPFNVTATLRRLFPGPADHWCVTVGARVAGGVLPTVYVFPENGRGPVREEAA